MSEHGGSGGSTRSGAAPPKEADEGHVHVRKADLVVVLEAAQHLHGTPLITAHDHERLGRAINSLRGQLAPAKPFSKRTRLRP
jgi:hypothetical protein